MRLRLLSKAPSRVFSILLFSLSLFVSKPDEGLLVELSMIRSLCCCKGAAALLNAPFWLQLSLIFIVLVVLCDLIVQHLLALLIWYD